VYTCMCGMIVPVTRDYIVHVYIFIRVNSEQWAAKSRVILDSTLK